MPPPPGPALAPAAPSESKPARKSSNPQPPPPSRCARPAPLTDSDRKSLPNLPGSSGLYLFSLLAMAAGYYLLLLTLVGLCILTVACWSAVQVRLAGVGIPVALGLLGTVGLLAAVARTFLHRSSVDPQGIRLARLAHERVFSLTDQVALDLGSPVIEQIHLVPGAEVCVTEEPTLWLSPGKGRRTLSLGMALLDRISLDHLRCILAHEYAHFSARDTLVSRYLGRVRAGLGSVVTAMRRGPSHWINPVYWLLHGYGYLLFSAAAAHSRIREYHADRRAVELYGKDLFEEMILLVYLESSFFTDIWLPRFSQTASSSNLFPGNLYRDVALARLALHASEGTEGLLGVLANFYETKPSRFDSHPTLVQRLAMQGIQGAHCNVPHPTRLPPSKPEDDALTPAQLALLHSAPPSAAETLFGPDLPKLQRTLSASLARDAQWMRKLARISANLSA